MCKLLTWVSTVACLSLLLHIFAGAAVIALGYGDSLVPGWTIFTVGIPIFAAAVLFVLVLAFGDLNE